MITLKYIISALAGYLLGSLSVSIFVSRLLGEDVRKKGSGNPGATNMARVYGLKAGILTLAGDMLKTAAAVLLGSYLLGDVGLALSGVCCMLGHCFPVYHGFRGGKAVSAGAAVALMIDWRVFLVVIGVFALTAALSRKVSLGSIAAALAVCIASVAFSLSLPRIVLAFFGAGLLILRHKENIRRLLRGTEPDFKPGGNT